MSGDGWSRRQLTCESPAEALADPDPEPAESWSCPGCGAVWGKRTDGGPGPLAGFLPAPVGLTEDEQEAVGFFRWNAFPGTRMAIVLAALDRLSAAPVDDRERVPEGWRVEWRGAWTFKEPGPPRPVLVPVSPSVDPEEKP